MFPRQQSPLRGWDLVVTITEGIAVADIDDAVVVLKGRGQLEDALWLVGLKVVSQVGTKRQKQEVTDEEFSIFKYQTNVNIANLWVFLFFALTQEQPAEGAGERL